MIDKRPSIPIYDGGPIWLNADGNETAAAAVQSTTTATTTGTAPEVDKKDCGCTKIMRSCVSKKVCCFAVGAAAGILITWLITRKKPTVSA